MRSTFRHYYRPTEDEFRDLWRTATFVFDTNVLLNLYTYPESARDELLKVLRSIQARVWIPYHVALEYQRNRINRIKSSQQKLQELANTVQSSQQKILAEIDSIELSKRNIGIGDIDARIKALQDAHSQLLEAVEAALKQMPSTSIDDNIRNQLSEVFADRTGGAPANQQAVDQLVADADARYAAKIPPGYKDANPKDDSKFRENGIEYYKKHGDLILWLQILAHAKEKKLQALILVTEEQKEDWWLREEGHVLAPRPELVKDAYNAGIEHFWMYSSEQFLKFANTYLEANVPPIAIEQVKEATTAATANYQRVVGVSSATSRSRHKDAVLLWLSQLKPECSTVIKNEGDDFPDIIVADDSLTVHGFEILAPWRLHTSLPRAKLDLALLRGKQMLQTDKLDTFSVIIIFDNLFAEVIRDARVSDNVVARLRAQRDENCPQATVYLGKIDNGQFKPMVELFGRKD